jgi:hypothetical protein
MNAYLSRRRSCAKPNNEEAPISGWILAAVVCAVLTAGFALDIVTAMAALIKAMG